jgi:hypothetical protein
MAGRIRLDLELTPAELGDFVRVEPPAFLDELVKQRAGEVLERRRTEQEEASARAPAADAVAPVASRLSPAEACSFTFGLLAYSIQLADGVARLIWHAMTG